MKLLLDESVPKRLGSFFPSELKVHTVQQMGWAGSSNGDLLRLASAHGFDALVTVDKGIEHQQHLGKTKRRWSGNVHGNRPSSNVETHTKQISLYL